MTWPQFKEACCRQVFLCKRSINHPYKIGPRWSGHDLSKIQEVSPYFTFRKYYSMLPCDWRISNLPKFCLLLFPTSHSSSNTFSHTAVPSFLLFVTLGHSLTYLCPTTIFNHLMRRHSARTGSEAVSVGRLWQRNLWRGLDGTTK